MSRFGGSAGKIVRLPQAPRTATVYPNGPPLWLRIRDYARLLLGRLACRLGIPGAIRATEISDAVTGQRIEIHVGPLATRINVNGRDYYFNRFTGRFDGTGSGCGCA